MSQAAFGIIAIVILGALDLLLIASVNDIEAENDRERR